MSLHQLRNVDFGQAHSNLTGSDGVGYSLYDSTGTITGSRTTTGVYQITSGSGIYAAYIEFPNSWRGQILWDTGTAQAGTYSTQYATEQYNYEENSPQIESIYNIEYGRWRIVSNQMIFYKEDNVTEIARFDLKDASGSPSSDTVYERTRNS